MKIVLFDDMAPKSFILLYTIMQQISV